MTDVPEFSLHSNCHSVGISPWPLNWTMGARAHTTVLRIYTTSTPDSRNEHYLDAVAVWHTIPSTAVLEVVGGGDGGGILSCSEVADSVSSTGLSWRPANARVMSLMVYKSVVRSCRICLYSSLIRQISSKRSSSRCSAVTSQGGEGECPRMHVSIVVVWWYGDSPDLAILHKIRFFIENLCFLIDI